MSEGLWIALIGSIGTIAAALVTAWISRKGGTNGNGSTVPPDTGGRPEPTKVEPIDRVTSRGNVVFPLVLQKTYFEQGFFNVGVSYEAEFGDDGKAIELLCEGAQEPILGTINRTANSNRSPRIMGGRKLRDWFQAQMSVMQVATITVLSPTKIRIVPRVA